MLRYLASGFLARGVSRRLARLIPNPILRSVAVAAVGYAANQVMTRRAVAAAPTPRLRSV